MHHIDQFSFLTILETWFRKNNNQSGKFLETAQIENTKLLSRDFMYSISFTL